jgi:histidyl-tRNA synthetase
MAFGIERIIDLMDILNLYPPTLGGSVAQVFVAVFGEATRAASTGLAAELRGAGINVELYLQDKALGKQLALADKKAIPVVALLGEDEIARGEVRLKRLADGYEIVVPRGGAADGVRSLLG